MRFSIEHSQTGPWQRLYLTDTQTGNRAEIIPAAGGILNAWTINHPSGPVQLIDGFSDETQWRDTVEKGFQGSKLSPFVCRVAQAAYAWEGRSYQIEKFHLNGAAIHGLIYDAPFEVIEKIVQNQFAELELKYSYGGTDPGYPFAYDCFVRYRLEPDNTLQVTTAIHNRSRHTIPLADGWHPYFGFGKPIDSLQLCFQARAELEYDEALIPTGRSLPTDRFSQPRYLKDISLDNGFELDFSSPQPLCTLTDPERGIQVAFFPDRSYPYLQLYTPPHRRSIAIENLSAAPDAFNNRIGLVSLEPDHTKTFSVRYQFREV